MNERRVVVTGVGVVSPIGNNRADFFKGLADARPGIRTIRRFPAGTFPTRIAGEVRGLDRGELSLPGQTFVRFKYYLIKLKNLDYHGFLNSENPLAFGLMAKMGYNRAERVRLKADFLGLILGSAVDPARKSLLVEFVETYLPLAGHERREFQQIVGSDQKYAKVEQMITTYEKEGTEKGKREVLILQLEKKFGRLDDAVKRTILQIDTPEKLDSLLLAILDADSLEDLPW